MLHPEWEEKQVIAEVEDIKEDYRLTPIDCPDGIDNIVNRSRGLEQNDFPQIPTEEDIIPTEEEV